MLKHRIITAGLLAPPVLGGLVFLPSVIVPGFFGVVAALGAWEWAGLAGWSTRTSRWAYAATLVAFLVFAYWLLGLPWGGAGLLGLTLGLASWWTLILYWLVDFQRRRKGIPRSRAVLGVAGLLVVVPAWSAMVALHRAFGGDAYLVISLLLLVWSADIGAFFAGRRWGKHRLAHRVSPGKTWEGVLGALLASVVVGWLCSLPLELGLLSRILFLVVCLVAVMFSVVGDLFESLIKRQAGAKDSGALLPGHGGVLDRIDSLMAAAPVFALGMGVLGVRA